MQKKTKLLLAMSAMLSAPLAMAEDQTMEADLVVVGAGAAGYASCCASH